MDPMRWKIDAKISSSRDQKLKQLIVYVTNIMYSYFSFHTPNFFNSHYIFLTS